VPVWGWGAGAGAGPCLPGVAQQLIPGFGGWPEHHGSSPSRHVQEGEYLLIQMRQDIEMSSEEQKAVDAMYLVEHGAPELSNDQWAEVQGREEHSQAGAQGGGVSRVAQSPLHVACAVEGAQFGGKGSVWRERLKEEEQDVSHELAGHRKAPAQQQLHACAS